MKKTINSEFGFITEEKQKAFEDVATEAQKEAIPTICGYYGRGCRCMNQKANRMPCMGCPLAEFASRCDKGAEHFAEIKKERTDIMRALHQSFGFDFCKPYAVASIRDHFTVNSIKKAVEAVGGGTSESWRVVALIRDAHGVYAWRDWSAVEIASYYPQGFSIDIEWRNGYDTRRSFDHLYAKGTFHDIRKSDTAEAVVIAQRYEHLTKGVRRYDYRHAELIREGERYHLISVSKCRAYDGSAEGVNSYAVRPFEGNGRTTATIPTDYRKHKDTTNLIDKSGYLLERVRADLQSRAKALRAERKKALYLATDDTAKVEELRNMLEIERKRLAHLVECARTSDMLEEIERKHFRPWGDGFASALRAFEKFEQKTEERSYPSVEEAQNAYHATAHKIFTMWEA